MKKLLFIFIFLILSCSQENRYMKNCIKHLQTKSINKNGTIDYVGNEPKITKEKAKYYCKILNAKINEKFIKNKGMNLEKYIRPYIEY